MENETLTLIVSSIATVASIIAILIAISTRKDSFYLKKYESFYEMESTKEIFIGRLIAFGFTEKDIENDGLTIDMLMYYNNLLNAIWIGNKIDNRARRIRKRFPLFYSKISFERKIEIVRKMDNKKRLFDRKTQTGQVIESDFFRIAWTKYLCKFWARTNTAKTAVLIEASLLNLNK